MNTRRRPHAAQAVALAAVLTAVVAMPASADNSVIQTINAGTLSASIADLTLGAVDYSHSAQSSTGTMVLTADDSSGSGAGWNVTVVGSDFVYSGAMAGTDIPAANFSLTSASEPASTAGDPVDPSGGPKVPSSFSPPATLDLAHEVLEAELTFGEGTYTQNLGVNLDIPAQSDVGTYTGTMTVTIGSGP